MPLSHLDMVQLLSRITVEVEVRRTREAWLRLWLATRLMRVACWIGNLGLKEKQAVGVIYTNSETEDE